MPVQPPIDDNAPGGPDDEASIPEAVWDLFLSDSESRIRASAPKEPSARAREVARRLREREEAAAAGRARRKRRWFNRLLFRLRCLVLPRHRDAPTGPDRDPNR